MGSVSYDDDPYCSFETKKFSEGIINAIDKVVEIVTNVANEPLNYIQFYKEPIEVEKDKKKEDEEGGGDGGGLL